MNVGRRPEAWFGQGTAGASDSACYMSDWDQPDLPDQLTSRDQRVQFGFLVFKGQNFKDLLFGLWQKGKTSQFQVKYTDHPASVVP